MRREAPFIGEAIDTLNPDRPREDEIDLLGFLRALWRGKLWIAAAVLVALAWGWYRANVAAVPLYTAQAVVAMETRDENVLDLAGVVTGLPGTLGTINTELGVMRSRGLVEKLVVELDLGADPEFGGRMPAQDAVSDGSPEEIAAEDGLAKAGATDPTAERRRMDAVIDRVLTRLRVGSVPDSYLFTIAVTTTDEEKSALIANTHARLYIEDQIEVKYRATEQATAWLTDRLGTLQAELEAAEGAVEAFASENRITRSEDLEILNLRVDDARDRLAELETRTAQLAAQLDALDTARDTGDWAAAAALGGDATLERLVARDAPEDEIAARFETVRDRLVVAHARSVEQGATLGQSIAVLRAEYARQSDNLVAYQQLEREVTASRTIYEYFLGRLKELSAQQGNLRADSRIVSNAAVPGGPSSPLKIRIYALALIAGLVIGGALVLLWEALHAGLRTGPELEAATGRPVMGQIPLVPRSEKRDVLSYFVEKPTSMAAEAVRNLRTSIVMSNVDQVPQVIMLTSSLPDEGKTTTAIALAQNFTGLGKRVLVIEGDIRHRVFRDYLDLKKTKGLLAVLSGQMELAEAVERSYLIDADVLVGERAAMNAADVFSSARFRGLIAEARRAYDVVIIDTPPVLLVPDARVVAKLADAVIYAVEWNSTAKRDVIAGLRLMTDGGIRVTGLALTRIDLKKIKRYGGYAGYGSYGALKKYVRTYHES